MKTTRQYILLIVTMLMVSIGVNATTPDSPPTDTVIINIDNNTRIIILVNDKSDLKNLTKYDFNAMIRDISHSVDTAENDEVVTIQDESGDNYNTNPNTDNSNNVVTEFRIGNYEIEVDPEEMEDAEIKTSESVESTTSQRYRGKRTRHGFNFEFGLNNYLENGKYPQGDQPYAVKNWGSWYVGLSSTQRTRIGSGFLNLEWSAKLNWYNFKLDDPNVQIQVTDNGTEYLPTPAEISGQKSKLTASYINAYLVPYIDFSKGKRKVRRYETPGVSISKYKRQGIRLGFGGYAGYRLGSHTKFKFRQNGDTDRTKVHGNLNLNNFRYGLRGQLGYRGMDLFINYDLNELFNENKGPAPLQAISFGFIL